MAKPTELYRVKRDGVTVGGRVYRAGDTVGYTDLSMANREKTWEAMAENDKFEIAASDENGDVPVVPNTTSESPSQPQGDPDGPLAGDSPKARAAKQFKNMETAGVVSQAAGLQGGTGADVDAMAERADAELEFRGEANSDAQVDESVTPEKVSPEPVTERPSSSRAAKSDEEKDEKKSEKTS